jgi:hypothetical protein
MNQLPRLFREDGAAVATGAPPDVAALMAKSGVKTESDSDIVPDLKIEEVKPTTAAVATPPAPEPAKPVETTAAAAPPAAKVEPAQAPVEASQPQPVDWKAELKKANHDEILKELGFDDKMVGFFNKWRTDGNIADYLRAVTVDYSKMTPEQLMKYQLEQEFPEFSPADLEELYQAKIIDAYKLNPDVFSETEVKRGKLMLTADAKRVRADLVQKQQEYILSAKPPAPPVDTQAQQREAEIKELTDKYVRNLNTSPATKELLTNKKLVMGEGDNTFNYEIADPQSLINVLQNPDDYVRHVFTEDGTPLIEKQLFIAAAAIDHKGLTNELIKFGMSLGAKRAVEQMENAKKPTGELSTGDAATLTPVQALARSGILTYG